MRKISLLALFIILCDKMYASPSSRCGFFGGWPDSLVNGPGSRVAFIALPDIPNPDSAIDFFMDLSVDAAVVRIPRNIINNNLTEFFEENNNIISNNPFSEIAPVTGSNGNPLYELSNNIRNNIDQYGRLSLYIDETAMEFLLLRNRERTDESERTVSMFVNYLNRFEQNPLETLGILGFLDIDRTNSARERVISTDEDEEFIRMFIDNLGRNIERQDLLGELESQGLLNDATMAAVERVFCVVEEKKETEENNENEAIFNNDNREIAEILIDDNNINSNHKFDIIKTTVKEKEREEEEEYKYIKEDEEVEDKKSEESNEEDLFRELTKISIEDSFINNDNHEIDTIKTAINEVASEEEEKVENVVEKDRKTEEEDVAFSEESDINENVNYEISFLTSIRIRVRNMFLIFVSFLQFLFYSLFRLK